MSNNPSKLLLENKDIVSIVIPEMTANFGFAQKNKYQQYDVYSHIAYSVGFIEKDLTLRLTMFFHDIGKAYAFLESVNGTRNFAGHKNISLMLTERILKRIGVDNETSENVLLLIENHDIEFNGSEKQIKKLYQKIGEANMRNLFKVIIADCLAKSDFKRDEKLASVEKASSQFENMVRSQKKFSISSLAVSGKDLLQVGFKQGKEIGNILRTLLEEVQSKKIQNNKEILLSRALSLTVI